MPPATVHPVPPQSILAVLDRLRGLSQKDVRPTWHLCLASATQTVPTGEWQTWPLATLNDRDHIPWPQGHVPLGLHQRFTWPADLNGYPYQLLGVVAQRGAGMETVGTALAAAELLLPYGWELVNVAEFTGSHNACAIMRRATV